MRGQKILMMQNNFVSTCSPIVNPSALNIMMMIKGSYINLIDIHNLNVCGTCEWKSFNRVATFPSQDGISSHENFVFWMVCNVWIE